MIITTRFGATGGAYVQDHLFASQQGYLFASVAHHFSEHTVKDYFSTFNEFTTFLGEDIPFEDATYTHLECSSLLRQQ